MFEIKDIHFGEYLNGMSGLFRTNKEGHENGVMGLGDRVIPMNTDANFPNNLYLRDGVYSQWNRDVPDPLSHVQENGGSTNLQGTHPFFLFRTNEDEQYYGVYSNVANAQDWFIQNEKSNETQLNTGVVNYNMISTGGIGEVMFIYSMGKAPDDVIRDYQLIVGKPMLVPRWSIGWNQGRYGYKNTSQLRDVVK